MTAGFWFSNQSWSFIRIQFVSKDVTFLSHIFGFKPSNYHLFWIIILPISITIFFRIKISSFFIFLILNYFLLFGFSPIELIFHDSLDLFLLIMFLLLFHNFSLLFSILAILLFFIEICDNHSSILRLHTSPSFFAGTESN